MLRVKRLIGLGRDDTPYRLNSVRRPQLPPLELGSSYLGSDCTPGLFVAFQADRLSRELIFRAETRLLSVTHAAEYPETGTLRRRH